jgi:hypothetical protein
MNKNIHPMVIKTNTNKIVFYKDIRVSQHSIVKKEKKNKRKYNSKE